MRCLFYILKKYVSLKWIISLYYYCWVLYCKNWSRCSKFFYWDIYFSDISTPLVTTSVLYSTVITGRNSAFSIILDITCLSFQEFETTFLKATFMFNNEIASFITSCYIFIPFCLHLCCYYRTTYYFKTFHAPPH